MPKKNYPVRFYKCFSIKISSVLFWNNSGRFIEKYVSKDIEKNKFVTA